MTLGLWHILPVPLSYIALHNETFDFQAALANSNFSVLIYFHGTGETRADSGRKYQLLTHLFHVISFDYRGKSLQIVSQLHAVLITILLIYRLW